MPLIRFDLIEGRDEESLKKLLDVAHEVVVEAFQVPYGDRYQIVTQHAKNEMVIKDTGLGFSRSDDVVVISITSTHRTADQKKTFYKLLVERLEQECGIQSNDVMVSITSNGAADWSFGFGRAQFLTGEL